MTETADPPAPLLSARGLVKSYAAPVLREVSLDLYPGEVHALMGANGAGKSTLARVLCGLTSADSGTMTFDGVDYRPRGRAAAARLGVKLVPQEPGLVPTLSVAENLFLGRWPSRFGVLDTRALNDAARPRLATLGLGHVDPATPGGRLGVGEQHLVSVAAALLDTTRVVVLDEPTAALADPQVERLFAEVRRLRAAGAAVVFVSHRLDELRRIADRVSVLRDGRLVATRPAASLGIDEAVRLMVGEVATADTDRPTRPRGTLAMRVENLTRGGRVRGVSFEAYRGEVLGLAGLVGSGRTELLRAVFGADGAESGTVTLFDAGGRARSSGRFATPREAVAAGLGMVPEDRKAEGLLLPLSVGANFSLARLKSLRRRFGRLDRAAEADWARDLGGRVRLVARSAAQPVEQLSGGNQQKVLIGRWLLRDPAVLLLDEPTRGIDVAARRAVHDLIDDLARRGTAVVMVSSETEELTEVCDRILVVSAGRAVATFERGRWSPESLLAAAFRGYAGGSEGVTP